MRLGTSLFRSFPGNDQNKSKQQQQQQQAHWPNVVTATRSHFPASHLHRAPLGATFAAAKIGQDGQRLVLSRSAAH